MDFTLDETARAAAAVAADVLRRIDEHRPSVAEGFDETTWKAMADAGLLGLAVPEELGGEGLGVMETSVVLTEVGRRVADVPALATLALGVLPVVDLGTAVQQRRLLAEVVTGDRVLTSAVREPSAPLPAAPTTTARPDGPSLVVSGTKLGVQYAARAHRVLVPVSLPDRTAVVLIDPAAGGVHLDRTPTSGYIPEYTIRLDEVRVPESEVLGGTGAVARLNAYALAGACAVADGVLAGALDLTSAHIGSREQFGKPLATFQAVAQQIADVYVASRTLHLAAMAANWRLATGRDATGDLAVAAYWLADQAPAALQTCHHLHGGLGLDVTYPLHRYSALATDLARLVGGLDERTDRLGDLVARG